MGMRSGVYFAGRLSKQEIRMTIRKKVSFAIGTFLVLFVTMGVISYVQIRRLDERLMEIINIDEPISAAAYELEINLIGTGFGLLGYLHDHDPNHLERIQNDEDDFNLFLKKYHQYVREDIKTTEGEEHDARIDCGFKIDQDYTDFRTIADKLIEIENTKNLKMRHLAQNFEAIDVILDESVQTSIGREDPDAFEKMQAALEMEINVNGIAKGLGKYLMTRQAQYEERIHDDEGDFQKFLEVYERLNLSSQEKQWARQIHLLFDECVRLAKTIIELDKEKEKGLATFVKIRREMDAVLDDEIQVLTRANLERGKEARHSTVHIVAKTILTLFVIGLIASAVLGVMITRSIIQPVTKLKEAAMKIGSGHLDTEIEITSKDEIGDLAASFNKMAKDLSQTIENLNREIVEHKRTEKSLFRTRDELIKASHKAGMAEVASDILHNVGNILNSIKISARFIEDKMFNSKAENLKKVADLIDEHTDDLETFLKEDHRGKHIPVYLTEAAGFILNEQADITKKLQTLKENINHIEQVIKAQQGYAKIGGVEVLANINETIEDAIQVNNTGLQRHGVDLKLELSELPAFHMDKQRILQILVNLISNSKHALSTNQNRDKILTIRSYLHEEDKVRIEVMDNGIGIPKQNITKIFTHGFTTRKDGHGFGLHSSALAAKAMNGSLNAYSEGLEQGATFTLELPLKLTQMTK